MIKCPLCGNEFDEKTAACSSCPFHGKCEMKRCPNCSYEFVSESKIVNFFKNLFNSPSTELRARRKKNEKSGD